MQGDRRIKGNQRRSDWDSIKGGWGGGIGDGEECGSRETGQEAIALVQAGNACRIEQSGSCGAGEDRVALQHLLETLLPGQMDLIVQGRQATERSCDQESFLGLFELLN